MSGEETEGGVVPVDVDLPPESAALLDDIAAARGGDADRETALRKLLAAHRAVRGDDPADAIGDRLDRQREEYVDLVEDVRQRVIQVKRETDRKAPADRLEDLESTVTRVEGDLTALRRTVETVEADLESLEGDVEAGFGNFEDALRALHDTTERVERRMDTLATAVVELREEVEGIEDGGDGALEALKRSAAREGVREADCGSCGEAVDVGLLTAAACPHCGRDFSGLDPASGFLDSATLRTSGLAGGEGDRDGPGADAGDRGDPDADHRDGADTGDRDDPDADHRDGADTGDRDDVGDVGADLDADDSGSSDPGATPAGGETT